MSRRRSRARKRDEPPRQDTGEIAVPLLYKIRHRNTASVNLSSQDEVATNRDQRQNTAEYKADPSQRTGDTEDDTSKCVDSASDHSTDCKCPAAMKCYVTSAPRSSILHPVCPTARLRSPRSLPIA